MIRSRFQGNTSNNIWRAEEKSEVAKEKEKKCGLGVLKNKLLSSWPPFVEMFMESCILQEVSSYSVFIIAPLDDIHL